MRIASLFLPASRFLAASLLLAASQARADVKLPAIFSEHMVVQADAKVPVWGWAEPKEEVRVALAGAKASATADVNGRWRVTLGKLPAGGPHKLVVTGKKNKLEVGDVLVGEARGGRRIEHGNDGKPVPQLRTRTKGRRPAAGADVHRGAAAPTTEPQADCQGSWAVCTPESVGGFSATAYFFGRDLHAALKKPVGLNDPLRRRHADRVVDFRRRNGPSRSCSRFFSP